MVYEKKCVQCDKMLDFGGRDRGRTPKNGIEFNGDLYCRDCVQEFIQFGIGDVLDRITELEQNMKEIREELGLERS